MNLVAKEFVAARELEDGVLILSRFAGAAGELVEALIVNPYHIDQTAEALHQGLTMHPAEQRERMRSLRERVQDFNIYRWAGRMLLDACEERQREKLRDRIERATGQPQGPCWCVDARFPPDLLAQLPPEAEGQACICAACVARFAAGEAV